MRRHLVILCMLLAVPLGAQAQSHVLTGRVTGASSQPVSGAVVREKGTPNQAITDAQGRYTLRFSGAAGAVIRISASGHLSRELAAESDGTMDVSLGDAVAVEGLVVVGSRRVDRSSTETPVAVDVIPVTEVAQRSGQLDLNQLLQAVAPSFNANRQSGADGADHIDPATLRGLGPDQTLVLINGQRRHQSSLINIFGSRGRGNTGTDLNAIPMSAIERIEILREGASAQYGSDAIAGVINIVLKSSTDELAMSASTGVHNARPPSRYDIVREEDFDGEERQVSANYGFGIGESGFLNLTGEYLGREKTNRLAASGDNYRTKFGDAANDNYGFFLNSQIPSSQNSAFYAFGGASFRQSDAFAWTREADDAERNVPAIYPNGFNPRILADITDVSASLGYRTQVAGWAVDVNNTYGMNRMDYTTASTLNASLGAQSPREFDAGGFSLAQNTTGLGATRLFPNVFSGMNLAFGTEFRLDRYQIFAGEEGSYRDYDGEGGGSPGAQGFPGFQPSNELDETRTNLGAYLDAEIDVAPHFTVAAATRFEDYSDFGSTLTGRLAARLDVTDAVALRASVGTGFRAPSLAQTFFNTTFTDFVAGEPVDKIIARNDAEITRRLGIPELQEEKSRNASLGLTARSGGFSATVDAYWVNIDDRIVLTGAFDASDPDIGQDLQDLNVGAAQFFTNALDTRSRGLDVVLNYAHVLGEHSLRGQLAANFNHMELGDIHTTARLAGKEDIYFGPREQAFLLASAPSSKIGLSIDHGWSRLNSNLRVTRFGDVTLRNWNDEIDDYDAAYTVDASVTYRLLRNASVTLGGTNLFNQYPTMQDLALTETGGPWDAVQMGFSGAFYFLKLNVTR